MIRRLASTTFLAAILALPLAAHAQQAAAVARGADLFDERCTMCHQREGGGQGPSLVGVVGRHAAALPGVNYSRALKASTLVWTPADLDRFLTNPPCPRAGNGHAPRRAECEGAGGPDRLSRFEGKPPLTAPPAFGRLIFRRSPFAGVVRAPGALTASVPACPHCDMAVRV